MLTKVRGRFTGVSGAIEVAEDPGDSTARSLSIWPRSTPAARPATIICALPTSSTPHTIPRVVRPRRQLAGHRGLLEGELTIRGITRPVALQAEYLGHAADPWGGHRAVFTAHGTLNREDWDLTWNLPLDGGGLLVSKEITIEIELEAVLQP